VPGSSKPKGWTANRLPMSQPPVHMPSKSFTGSSAASIDVSDATADASFPVSSFIAIAIAIGLVGTTALVSGVLPGLYLAKSDSASRIGAIVYGALSLLTIVFFWSGAPGLGAVAAWLGGLTRG
jgi:hypothetical protein